MEKTKRDDQLDIAKGIGITLVIWGHLIQGQHADFDTNILFRVIYSFHMPLFFFISGAVLYAKLSRTTTTYKVSLDTAIHNFLKNCRNSFLRLMIPFITWSIILFFTGKRYIEMSLLDWSTMVIKSVDYSLWFLPALFYCLVFFYFSQLIFIHLHHRFSTLNTLAVKNQKEIFFLIASLIFSMTISKALPNWFGISFFKSYYIYFILGSIWYNTMHNSSKVWLKILLIFTFISLVPFWYRTEAGPAVDFLTRYTAPYHIEHLYRLVVAMTGIFTILSISETIKLTSHKNIRAFFSYCGAMSLGIYAFQFQFLGIKPYFIAPLFISLFCCYLVNKIPIIRMVLLGSYK